MVELKTDYSSARNMPVNPPPEPAYTVTNQTNGRPFTIKPQLMELWSATKQLAGAEGSIVAMKAVRVAVIGVFGMIAIPVVLALAIYGFTLLDAAARIGLEKTGIDWLAPLVRGGVYFGVPALAALVIWHLTVGWGSSEKKSEEARHA